MADSECVGLADPLIVSPMILAWEPFESSQPSSTCEDSGHAQLDASAAVRSILEMNFQR